jgi:hypothetical protein
MIRRGSTHRKRKAKSNRRDRRRRVTRRVKHRTAYRGGSYREDVTDTTFEDVPLKSKGAYVTDIFGQSRSLEAYKRDVIDGMDSDRFTPDM